jgi:hypothetical protein
LQKYPAKAFTDNHGKIPNFSVYVLVSLPVPFHSGMDGDGYPWRHEMTPATPTASAVQSWQVEYRFTARLGQLAPMLTYTVGHSSRDVDPEEATHEAPLLLSRTPTGV